MAEPQPTLNELAAKVTELSAALTQQLAEKNVPVPSFAADSPTSYKGMTEEIFLTRQKIVDVLNDMWILTQGPSESIFNYVHNVIPDAAALNVLNHFNFWAAVPLDGSASYAEIAKHTSLPQDVVYRVLQHAVTLRLFAETEPGKSSSRIQHTSRSAALAKQAGLRALVSSVLDISSTPMMVLNEALDRYSRGKPELTQEMSETAFALLHSGGELSGKHRNSWDFLENDGIGEKKGWRQKSFVEFMSYIKEIFQLEGVVLDAFDWKAAGNTTLVDVGGSAGADAFMLAQKFPELKIVVQDMPKVQPVFEADVPEDLKSRVSFVAHDLNQPQTVQADIYMLKLILHDYPEPEAAKIIRALVPALKPGNRVVVIEYIGKVDDGGSNKEGPPIPRSIQQMGTATDLRMMALFNAKERPAEAYRDIFRQADERFEIVSLKANPLTFFAVIEAVWRG
ncbi:hypothetical protein MGN70_008603 [Eutypa lata]|uniref:Putative sterigmatocystin 8-o-methyltransferase protein n=1 Tax=Eutypa lata (strain UCR-EL1) TaxID=1287681 RepID=M7SK26_EUTLA|nr:putative sterigmatocystin 8-o-methyltransferase protein [Eutypa lata UCREL1]KAI1248996.1 hypothetical protein MGN70_008603 [Eutypa lata]